jgi:ubiquinone/menaquinone biosynthesis C-methylase UbiE
MEKYVHGYSERETERLHDQANTLAELLHYDTVYTPGARVLEAGCGTGAQTVHLAQKSPGASFISVDISNESLNIAQKRINKLGISNVEFIQSDIFKLPFEYKSFDNIFICFVLEHLNDPVSALKRLKKYLKTNGTITVIEGDHGSYYCHPGSSSADKAVQCLIDIQKSMGGNSLIGRELYPLLRESGFNKIKVLPRIVYVDASKPGLVEGFTKNTFIAMVEGVRDKALSMNLTDPETWEKGINDLYRTTEYDGTFCYTFFKGRAMKNELKINP